MARKQTNPLTHITLVDGSLIATQSVKRELLHSFRFIHDNIIIFLVVSVAKQRI